MRLNLDSTACGDELHAEFVGEHGDHFFSACFKAAPHSNTRILIRHHIQLVMVVFYGVAMAIPAWPLIAMMGWPLLRNKGSPFITIKIDF